MIVESLSMQSLRQSSPARTDSAVQSPSETSKVDGKSLPSTGEVMPMSAAEQAAAKPSESEIAQAVETLANYVQNTQRELQFSVDEGTGRTVIRVLDAETQETIRQIPSDEILTLARHIEQITEDKGGLLEVLV
jgi:flagellar protein FlaG